MCKIPESVNILEGRLITEFDKDCNLAQCNPQENLPDINGKVEKNYTYELDKDISLSIKNNKLDLFKSYFEKHPNLKTRHLTHSSDGNTVYHEAFKYHAKHIIVYLLKNITKNSLNRLNSKGENILLMAFTIDDPNSVQMCLKLGSNINSTNNKGDTPLFYAIKSGIYNNVLTCLNNNADIYHKNRNKQTPFIVACTCKERHVDIVRLLVKNGSDIDVKNKNNKTMLNMLLEKENLNKEETTKKNKKDKKELDINIEDEKIRTLLQNIKIKSMGIDLNKELSQADTQRLEGILYTVEGRDKLKNPEVKFTLNVDFQEKKMVFPEDLHYPHDLEETHLQPHDPGVKDFSHEPYFLRYKDMNKDRMEMLKRIVMLTKWDNNRDEKKKTQIIDDIMTGKLSFDNYKYQVFNDNNITQEQTHLFDNIDDDTLFEFKDPHKNDSEYVRIKIKRKEDKEGKVTDKKFDIEKGTEKELKEIDNKRMNNELSKVSKEAKEKEAKRLEELARLYESAEAKLKREEEEEEKKRLDKEQRKAQENKKSKFQKFWEDFKNKLSDFFKKLGIINNDKKLYQNWKFLVFIGIILGIICCLILIPLRKKNIVKSITDKYLKNNNVKNNNIKNNNIKNKNIRN